MKRATDNQASGILFGPDDVDYDDARKVAVKLLNCIDTPSAGTAFMAGLFLMGSMMRLVHHDALNDGSVAPDQVGTQVGELFANVMRLPILLEDILNEAYSATSERQSQVRDGAPLAMRILDDLLDHTAKWPLADVARAATFLAVSVRVIGEIEDNENLAAILHSDSSLRQELRNRIAESIGRDVRDALNEVTVHDCRVTH